MNARSPHLGAAPARARLPLHYGALQFALSFLALPLYVFVPAYETTAAAMPLALVGALLLVSRLFDAITDPLLGRLADRALHAGWGLALIVAASVTMATGFLLLLGGPAVLRYRSHALAFDGWVLGALMLTYLGYSAASITHQAWGARLVAEESGSSRLYAWREALGLLGVLSAAAATRLDGARSYATVFAASLALALVWLRRVPAAPTPRSATMRGRRAGAAWLPLRQPAFRRLLTIQVVSSTAAALPATLVLFFIRDRLREPGMSGVFLGIYFGCAALAAPLWGRFMPRLGAARAWLFGMLATVASFASATALHAGDAWGYAGVCASSGAMLGADLILPPALLTELIGRLGHANALEGAYFALWNMATKLALALAAGLALPALAWLGYQPGVAARGILPPLVFAYGVAPAVMKIGAAAMLWFDWIRVADAKRGPNPA